MERFWSKVEIKGPDECWPWKAARLYKVVKGEKVFTYGNFGWKEASGWTMRRAHRIAYFLTHGTWPAAVLHSCDNPVCCNPKHLIGGTQQQNIADCVAKRRNNIGEKNARSKLKAADLPDIKRRRASGETNVAIGRDYGVSESAIRKIGYGVRWQNVTTG